MEGAKKEVASKVAANRRRSIIEVLLLEEFTLVRPAWRKSYLVASLRLTRF